MGRLISEDDVMHMLTSVELNNGTITDAKSELRNVKTAYDVEKVMAELKEEKYKNSLSKEFRLAGTESYYEAKYMAKAFEQAIEIVKRGGDVNGNS